MLKEIGRLGCVSRILWVEFVGSGMGVGLDLTSNFFKKRGFLKVILPNPLTQIQYWQCGRTMTTLAIVFYWWLSWFWRATMSLACRGRRLCGIPLLYLCIPLVTLLLVGCCNYPLLRELCLHADEWEGRCFGNDH